MRKTLFLLVIMAVTGVLNAQSHYWTPITGNQYTMTVSGPVTIDGEVQTASTLEIGAFCGDECRASTFPSLFPITGEYIVMMNIRGNVYSGETITFKLYDHESQQELDLSCLSTVEYEADAIVGTIGAWYEFAFASVGIHNIAAGAWSNSANWYNGIIPDSSSDVSIENDCTVDIDVEVASLSVSEGVTLTIQSGSTLTVIGDLSSVDVTCIYIEDGGQLVNESEGVMATLEKDIEAYTQKDTDGWYLISSPVDGMEIDGSQMSVTSHPFCE